MGRCNCRWRRVKCLIRSQLFHNQYPPRHNRPPRSHYLTVLASHYNIGLYQKCICIRRELRHYGNSKGSKNKIYTYNGAQKYQRAVPRFFQFKVSVEIGERFRESRSFDGDLFLEYIIQRQRWRRMICNKSNSEPFRCETLRYKMCRIYAEEKSAQSMCGSRRYMETEGCFGVYESA